jgi:hypothetical protein
MNDCKKIDTKLSPNQLHMRLRSSRTIRSSSPTAIPSPIPNSQIPIPNPNPIPKICEKSAKLKKKLTENYSAVLTNEKKQKEGEEKLSQDEESDQAHISRISSSGDDDDSDIEDEGENEDGMSLFEDDEEEDNFECDALPPIKSSISAKESFKILSLDEDIAGIISAQTDQIASVLGLSRHESSVLLRQAHFDAQASIEEYLSKESVAESATESECEGLMDLGGGGGGGECPICFNSSELIQLSPCSHSFCSECLVHYIKDFIKGGSSL